MATSDQGISCKELVELLTEYFDGTLSPAEIVRFDKHLAICSGCRAYLQQLRVTIATLGKLGEESISPDAAEKLLHAFRNWRA